MKKAEEDKGLLCSHEFHNELQIEIAAALCKVISPQLPRSLGSIPAILRMHGANFRVLNPGSCVAQDVVMSRINVRTNGLGEVISIDQG